MPSQPVRRHVPRQLASVVLLALLGTACGSTVQVSQTGSAPSGGDGLGVTPLEGSALPGGSGTTTGGPAAGGTGASGSSTGATSGTGGTSGSTGSAAQPGAGSSTGSTGAAAAAVPATGPGWDAKFVYIGVNTQKDVATVAQSAGANGLDAGDQEGQANAVIAYLNSRGGILGRQVKAVFHDNSTVDANGNPDRVGNESCTFFTQDRKVIAVLNPVTLIDVDSFRSCLAKNKVPLFSASVAPVSRVTASQFAPYFFQSTATTWDDLAPVLVRQLKTAGYFDSAWDTNNGRSAPGKATVGILTPDTTDGIRTGQTLDKALASVGSKAVQTFRFSTKNNNADMSSAVLQFRGNGIDHVIGTESSLVAFQLQAQSQGYRPRYGVHTLNAPLTFLQSNGGATQNTGAIGVGWAPSFDVDDARDPGNINPGVPLCDGIMKAGNQSYSGKRLARTVAYAFCDGLRLIAEGAKAGGGLNGLAIHDGVLKVAPGFHSAFSFASGLRPGRLTVPGGVRPLEFKTDCACYHYSSTTTTRL
jgi:hypothetical protein